MEIQNTKDLEIQECLGEGLNSRVYRAFRSSKELGVRQIVAVKILKSEKRRELLSQECGKLLRVRSRHCVAIYGWEVLAGFPAIILEYIEGITLQDLWLSGRLQQRLLNEVVAQAVQGVRELNQFGIAHGDLNLTNIMVDREGVVRLLDFGFFNCDYQMTTPEFASSAVMMGEPPDLLSDLASIEKIQKYLMAKLSARGTQEQAPGIGVQQELGCVVSDIWKARSQLSMPQTRRIAQLEPTARASQVRNFAVGLLALLFVFQDSQASRMRPLYRIELRSTKWQEAWVGDAMPCYSPCDILVPDLHVRLDWRGVNGAGNRIVQVPSSGVLRLGDNFFR